MRRLNFMACLMGGAMCILAWGCETVDDTEAEDLWTSPRAGTTEAQCAVANEGSTAKLSCPSGQVIDSITFASYGTPTGACPSFAHSACHASSSKSQVEPLCLNKPSCNIEANNAVFGDPCAGKAKKLAVAFTCKSVAPAGQCAQVAEGSTASLSCPSGQVIKAISFASYGTPSGTCPSFMNGTCHATSSQSKVESSCLNKQACSVAAKNAVFGDPCGGVGKKLAIAYACSGTGTVPGTQMPVFLMAGQSNMEGNVDQTLFNQLMSELGTGTPATLQQRLIDRLTSWYYNYDGGYAMYGYAAQRVALEASELIRLSGSGLVNASLTQPYSKVLCTRTDSAPQALALNCGNPYGPELILGHALGTTSYSPTSLIKVAKGGTNLKVDWLPPSAASRTGQSVGPLYKQLSQRIKSLQSNPASVHPNCTSQKCQWGAFIWFQGENDTFDSGYAQAYQQNLLNLISDVRAEIGSPKLPVIIVEIGAWGKDMDFGRTVAAAQQAVTKADPYAALVVTDDLSAFYHYDPAAQLIIGERIAKALVPMLGGTGDPDPGTAKCAQANEGGAVSLSCPSGQVIKSISFASYGNPSGSCPSFAKGTCHASSSPSKVQALCLNKSSCSVGANNGVFGDPCEGVGKKLAVAYACGSSGTSDNEGYVGTGQPLPVRDYHLAECDDYEKTLLKKEGFTRFRRVSIGQWRDIVTIQATSLIDEALLDGIATETIWVLTPLIQRYPERLKTVLDFNKGTINIAIVWGAGDGWSGGMGDEGMTFKRNATQDGGLFHEWGHLFDIHDSTPDVFRDHAGAIIAAEEATGFDKYCFKDPGFINQDGTCQKSEFIAEKYREMMYVQSRALVQKNTPEVYTQMLKYVPAPSSRQPFKGVYYYDLPDCPDKCLLGNK